MEFLDCYLCGALAVRESVKRDRTTTVFCTRRLCGRYDITQPAMQALDAGARLREDREQIMHRVYVANRQDQRVLVTEHDLQAETET